MALGRRDPCRWPHVWIGAFGTDRNSAQGNIKTSWLANAYRWVRKSQPELGVQSVFLVGRGTCESMGILKGRLWETW